MTHDQNFKNLIVDYPHAAIRFFAPEAAEDLDDSVSVSYTHLTLPTKA